MVDGGTTKVYTHYCTVSAQGQAHSISLAQRLLCGEVVQLSICTGQYVPRQPI